MDLLLLNILNAQSKGNPYHDKDGKFCSGPNKAFGLFSYEKRHMSDINLREAALGLGLPLGGPDDLVMTSMNNDQLVAAHECNLAAKNVANFNRNVAITHDEAPEELRRLSSRMSAAAEDMSRGIKYISQLSGQAGIWQKELGKLNYIVNN